MKASILCLSFVGLTLVGCTHTYVEKPVAAAPAPTREVIVEQAPPREIIVEKPVVMQRNCLMGSSTFSHGSLSCQTGLQYRCNDGRWESQGSLC